MVSVSTSLFCILGVTIYTPTYVLNQSEVIIMFDNGAGVEVVDNQGFMTARVFLPWSFIVSIDDAFFSLLNK